MFSGGGGGGGQRKALCPLKNAYNYIHQLVSPAKVLSCAFIYMTMHGYRGGGVQNHL